MAFLVLAAFVLDRINAEVYGFAQMLRLQIVVLSFLAASPALVRAACPPDVMSGTSRSASGIWYSTWYWVQCPYAWLDGHGNESTWQGLADVNDDLLDDAVVWFAGDGAWYVALSTGAGFANYNEWRTGHGIGSTHQMLADVDNDGMADAVVAFATGTLAGKWFVALSTGDEFAAYGEWIEGFGAGSSRQMLADVNDDGYADAVAYWGATGTWEVALSTGTSFVEEEDPWATGHGVGSTWQGLGDTDGADGADAVVVFVDGGDWYVATSNGLDGFNGYNQWHSNHGHSSTSVALGDIDNDGTDDAVAYYEDEVANYAAAGDWTAALSTGSGFGTSTLWKSGFGHDGATRAMLGSITTDGTSDAVAFYPQGLWRSKCSEGDDNLFYQDIWAHGWKYGYDIAYAPLIGDYDSGDHAVIDAHIQMIADAGFDYLIFDLTNHVETAEPILPRALEVADRLEASATGLQFAVAIGGMHFNPPEDPDPDEVEREAALIWDYFVAEYPASYFWLDRKPLLVNYFEDWQKDLWCEYGDHSNSDLFTMRYLEGEVTEESDPGTFGWGMTVTLPHDEVMTVMAGWNNYVGADPVPRETGDFFSQGWREVVTNSPEMVVVNSFNEFAEDTAIEPAYTLNILDRRDNPDPWLDFYDDEDPDFYWTLARQWNHVFRTGCYAPGTYIKSVSSSSVYQVSTTGSLIYQGTMPYGEPILFVPSSPSAWIETVCPNFGSGVAGHTASSEFSGSQGKANWNYRSSTGALTYQSSTGSWKPATETYPQLWDSGGHPAATLDAVRRWDALGPGRVRISGYAAKGDTTGGDGVLVSIRHYRRGTEVTIWEEYLEHDDSTGVDFELGAVVKAGEYIDFVIGRGASSDIQYDSTDFDPTIEFVSYDFSAAETLVALFPVLW